MIRTCRVLRQIKGGTGRDSRIVYRVRVAQNAPLQEGRVHSDETVRVECAAHIVDVRLAALIKPREVGAT